MKISIVLTVLLSLVFGCKQPSPTYYTNPILQGFYPDPSICRVGDDYYLVNSSFSFFPGLPLFHSNDLVHWNQIGNALDRPEQLNLDGLDVSQGIYAPTLRYHKGLFYIVCTVVGGINNFVITADDPAGPWSMPVPLPYVDGMDPDLFFDDDGSAYVSSCASPDELLYEGHRSIVMYTFDITTLTTSDQGVVLVNGGSDISKQPIWCEGPHLYKRKDFYYLVCAEGGTSNDHSVVVFRSQSLDEPFVSYEHNPILTQRYLDPKRTNAVTNTGHADFVELPSGEWWSVFLGCRPYSPDNHFNTGRETFMLAVEWDNNWPMILRDEEEVNLTNRAPDLPVVDNSTVPFNGTFTIQESFSEKTLPSYFLFVRTPKLPFYAFPEDEKGIILNLLPQSLDDKTSPAFIGRRQQHTTFEMTVAMDFSSTKENELAGISAFQNDERYYFFGKNSQGLVVMKGGAGESNSEIEVSLSSNISQCYLKMSGDASSYSFHYSLDNVVWEEVIALDAAYLSTAESGGFVGTILGLYASSNGEDSDNSAHFPWVSYQGSE